MYQIAKNIRLNILKAANHAGSNSAHIGGALSLVEIFSVLFSSYISKTSKSFPKKVILSKGHACLVLYSSLAEFKRISHKELLTFEKNNSKLLGHPVKNEKKGIEFSSGSLGMGLSYAAGLSFGYNFDKKKHQIFVVIGDGECNEGSIWEAAMTISHHNLINITIILDANGYQQTGKTKDILDLKNLEKKWQGFGFHTIKIDGHNFTQINKALSKKIKKPKIIIAKTIKGRGVQEFENNNTWHHNVLTKSKYEQIIKSLK